MKVTNLLSGVLSLVLAGSLFTSCNAKNEAPAPKPIEVAAMQLEPSDAKLFKSYPATIQGKNDIQIRPQITGFITAVHVDEGAQVSKGAVLFTIDQVQLEAAVRSAKASVVAAEANVATAELTSSNNKKLFDKNIISEYQYKTSVLAYESAVAQMKQAEAALINAEKSLSYSVITAPAAGVVGAIPNRIGTLASPSSAEPLTTISDVSDVYAYVSLNERQLLALTKGGSISLDQAIKSMPEVTLLLSDGTEYAQKGKVATISGVMGANTGTASVRVLFKNTNNMLRSGATGTILIPEIMNDRILVPQKATYELQDRKYVYLLNDSNKVASKAITIEPINDGVSYIITDGLKAGDKIVTEGVGTVVRDGMTISPKMETK